MAKTYRRITSVSVKKLANGGKLTEHGITVQRTTDGDLRYTIAVMVDGQRIHRVIGRQSEGVTRTQAELAIETLRTDARADRLNLPVGRKTHRTFAEAATQYLARMDSTGGRNMKSKRYHIERILMPRFGSKRVDRITTQQIQEFVVARRGEGLKQATINRELATLSHMYRRMAKWKWLSTGDIPEFHKGAEPRKKIMVLSDDQCDRLLEAAIDDIDERSMLFVAFGLNTAMRHSEILRVMYEQVDLQAKRVFIPEAKAGEREQPITSSLATIIEAQQKSDGRSDGYLFPNRRADGPHPHRLSMAKQFRRVVTRAGLDPTLVTPHVMRHSAITRLVRAGVDLPTIQRISGHKTLSMVLRYVHIHGAHIDAAITHLDRPATIITQDLQRAA